MALINNFGQALQMVDLVGFQSGSIVSRTLIKKEAGSVTVFAFDQGQGLSEHAVPHDALIYLLDGEAEITLAGKKHSLKRGDMILMPGNQPHAVNATKRFKMVLTMIRS